MLCKRRKLNFNKCVSCRKDKQKCEPVDRDWPGQRCDRCIKYNYECSANSKAKPEAGLADEAESSNGPKKHRTTMEYLQTLTYLVELQQTVKKAKEYCRIYTRNECGDHRETPYSYVTQAVLEIDCFDSEVSAEAQKIWDSCEIRADELRRGGQHWEALAIYQNLSILQPCGIMQLTLQSMRIKLGDLYEEMGNVWEAQKIYESCYKTEDTGDRLVGLYERFEENQSTILGFLNIDQKMAVSARPFFHRVVKVGLKETLLAKYVQCHRIPNTVDFLNRNPTHLWQDKWSCIPQSWKVYLGIPDIFGRIPLMQTTTSTYSGAWLHLNSEGQASNKKLITQHKDIDGQTLLHFVAMGEEDMRGVVPMLVKNGVDSSAVDSCQRTALHIAISEKNWYIALDLIENMDSVVINIGDKHGETPLHYMFRDWGWVRSLNAPIIEMVVRKLINHGANVLSRCGDGLTPLHLAIQSMKPGSIDDGDLPQPFDCKLKLTMPEYRPVLGVLAALLQGNPNAVSAEDNGGNTPLHYLLDIGETVVESFYPEILDILLDWGADILAENKLGETVIHLAIHWGCSIEQIKLLVSKGANAIKHHESGDHEISLELLFEIFFEQRAIIDPNNDLGFYLFCTAIQLGCKTLVEFFIASGIDINMRDEEGYTVLDWAVSGNSSIAPEIIQILLNNGLEKNIVHNVDGEGNHVLHNLFVGWGRDGSPYEFPRIAEVIHLLADKGVALSPRDIDNWTPLHFAARFSNYEAAEALLRRGADIFARNIKGRTPLHELVGATMGEEGGRQRAKVIRLLLEYGAGSDEKNDIGISPPALAEEEYDEIAADIMRTWWLERQNASWSTGSQLVSPAELLMSRTVD